jgi:hypothetical protein
MTTAPELADLLNKVFDRVREGRLPEAEDASQYEEWRRDFVFHLMDWTADVERLRELFDNPHEYDVEAASHLIVSFLIHVIPHLNNAGRLLLDEIVDPFALPESKRR